MCYWKGFLYIKRTLPNKKLAIISYNHILKLIIYYAEPIPL